MRNGRLGSLSYAVRVSLIILTVFMHISSCAKVKSSSIGSASAMDNSSGEIMHSDIIKPTDLMAIDDIFAIACTVVYGRVAEIYNVKYNGEYNSCVAELEVMHIYNDFELIYAKDSITRIFYDMSDGTELKVGSEYILVLSDARINDRGNDASDPDIAYQYLVFEPKYSIMESTSEGIRAGDFIRSADPHLYDMHSEYYPRETVDEVINENIDKLKSLSRLQIVPPN